MNGSVITMTWSVEELKGWWKHNRRDFPWRKETDPYRILLAELFLHRTRAETVAPIYRRFVQKFPDVVTLSRSNEDILFGELGALGLRWRTVSLLKAARVITDEFHGKVPREKAALLKLPGIGDYIASAIRVFAYNQVDPLIDTNTVRVISRINGFIATDSTRKGNEIREIYSSLMKGCNPRIFGFALIDLAALVCLPRRQRCHECPISKHCITGAMNLAGSGCIYQ